MKRVPCLLVFWLVTTPVWARSCQSGTLATYIGAGFSCSIGDLLFSNFTNSTSASGGAVVVPPADVAVLPAAFGFQFGIPSKVDRAQTIDITVGFMVTKTSGSLVIASASMAAFNFTTDGTVAVTVTANNGLSLFLFSGSGGTVARQTGTFSGLASLNVVTNIKVNGGATGSAALSQVALQFDPTQLVISPTSVDFGNQFVGWPSSPHTLTVTNTGNTTVTIGGIAVAGDFTMWNTTCGTSLQGGQSCTMLVSFRPRMPGARSGTITIKDNAPDSPHIVSLSGVGSTKTNGIY